MTLLINTASYYSMVGLVDKNKIIKKKIWAADLRQSEELLPMIERIVGKQKIDGIIAVTGPGSYTGLRVGVATANSLGYGWNCKVVGVDRFEMIGLKYKNTKRQKTNNIQISKNKNYVIILENINDLIYSELRIKNNELRFVGTVEDLLKKVNEPCYFVGQISEEQEKILKQNLGNKVLGIEKKDDFGEDILENLIGIGRERFKIVESGEIVKPEYLRPPKITKPKNGGENK